MVEYKHTVDDSTVTAKSLAKSFSTGTAIAKDFAKASVNGTIDNIQFLRAQCEWNLRPTSCWKICKYQSNP